MSTSSRELKGALIGTLLGDSWVTNRGEFGCQQVTKDLVEFKWVLLNKISPQIDAYIYKRPSRVSIKQDGTRIHSKESFIVQTNRNAHFLKLRQILCTSGTKQVTRKVLQKLTPLGIALWFMDDGYLDFKQSSITRNLRICTDNFDEQSIREMLVYFNDSLGIQAKVFYHVAHKGADRKPRLSFNAYNSQKLISLVYKYFLPSFMYKIDLQYKEYTLNSGRCSEEYRTANDYILQHITKKI